MTKLSSILLILIVLFALSGCKEEVDVNSEWQEIPVMYCILSPQDSVHYVRLNKAFLGDIPADQMADESDSLFYDAADVWISVMENGSEIAQLNFVETNEIPKDSGYFASDRNPIYKYEGNLTDQANDAGKKYQLHAYIPEIDLDCNSDTISMVQEPVITYPTQNQPALSLTHYDFEDSYPKIKYMTAENGKLYKLSMNFYYLDITTSGDSILNVLTMDFGNEDNIDEVGVEISKELNIRAFYDMLKDNIDPPGADIDKRLVQYPQSIEFMLASAGVNYYIYWQSTQPSTGIVQDKPFFTNINNGVGLFAARNTTQRSIALSPATLDSISRSVYTGTLGFASKNDPYYLGY